MSIMLAPCVGAYLAGINTVAVGMFLHDKRQAQLHQWRVPEKTLQLTALMGGWIGGIVAMQKFRHKTKKQAFLIPYYGAVAANVAAFGAIGISLTRHGVGLNSAVRDVQKLMG
eukprot:NODE_2647_length_661_cov_81.687908_g2177_i0.p1 GENE.NODE_2647_length_661_cov_81.687908_g2177_i0~~NODE_2647_length_661_cov_81.687908_g2177_i0.p1  ORF type:complete len:113 (+),score=26.05 NODE_2647_length_661_cov_81.687908_g2177_i0:53-391(+)